MVAEYVPRKPTPAECTAGTTWELSETRRAMACWYPQMGGYGAICVVTFSPTGVRKHNDCFDAYVWHDGEFPFGDGNPRELHHCLASQFIEFGKTVEKAMGPYEVST
jgi:hypothetical protein